MRLPSHVSLLSARILLLRLTVPADIYQSGISIEIQGIRVKANVQSKDETPTTTSKKRRTSKAGLPKGVKANLPRSTRPTRHDPGGVSDFSSGGEDDDLNESILPSAGDLAQSFLQTEPLQEKAEFKSEIAKSQNMDQSLISEDMDQDEAEGLGAELSLPGFVADFIKGVVDRLKLSVSDIQIEASLKLDSSSNGSSDYLQTSEEVVVCLDVDSVEVPEVSKKASSTATDEQGDVHAASLEFSRARIISIAGIKASLLSTSALSSFMTQLSQPPSPALSRATSKVSEALSSPATKSVGLGMMRPMTQHQTTQYVDTNLEASITTSQSHSPELAPADMSESKQSVHSESPWLDSRHGEIGEHSRSFIDQVEEDAPVSFGEDSDVLSASDIHRFRPQSSQQRELLRSAYSVDDQDEDMDDLSQRFDALQHGSERQAPTRRSILDQSTTSIFDDTNETTGAPSSPRAVPSTRENLAESRLFTHQEAESLYLSAMSQDLKRPRKSTIPGSWSDTESDGESSNETADVFHDTQPSAKEGLHQSASQREPPPLDPLLAPHEPEQTSPNSSLNDSPPASLYVSRHDDAAGQGSSSSEKPKVHRDGSSTSSQPLESSETTSVRSSASKPRNLATSRAPMKPFFVIDQIEIQIPQSEIATEPVPPEEQSKDTPTLPGAFSTHQTMYSLPPRSPRTTSIPKASEPRPEPISLAPTSVHIHNILFLMDIAFIRLLVVISQHISQFSAQEKPKTALAEKSGDSSSDFALRLDSFGLNFIHNLRTFEQHSFTNPQEMIKTFSPVREEVLLRLAIEGFAFSKTQRKEKSTTEVLLRKLIFGYWDEPILSFDSTLKMRDSVRDVLTSLGHDVKVTRTQVPGSPADIHVWTAPLHLHINIGRLEDAISWFGGLSSVLDLGSSVMSTVTIKDAKSQSPKPKSRGVRFEAQEPVQELSATDHDSTLQSKVNLRIEGLAIDLRGRACLLRLEGSAIRVASRQDVIKMTVDILRFHGPLLYNTTADPPIAANVDILKLEYRNLPTEANLDKLLALLSPSKDRGGPDDDIVLETLMRQRKKGGLLKVDVSRLSGTISQFHEFHQFGVLAEELGRLSSVAKYLPEDDRPGLLILSHVETLKFDIDVNERIGIVTFQSRNLDSGVVTFPFLFLFTAGSVNATHQEIELIGEGTPSIGKVTSRTTIEDLPMIMVRFIGEEMEPTLKVKLFNLRLEYHLSTVMTIMGISETASGEVIVSEMINSMANLSVASKSPQSSSASTPSNGKLISQKPMKLNLTIRDTLIGLNPKGSQAKGLVVLSDCRLISTIPQDGRSDLDGEFAITKASLLIIDDVANLVDGKDIADPNLLASLGSSPSQLQSLAVIGYVSVGEISSAKIAAKMTKSQTGESLLDVEIRDDLFVLETCADSTQTLTTIMGGLAPPTPPSKGLKYRTEVVPIENMLASFTGDAFQADPYNEDDTDYSTASDDDTGTVALDEDEIPPDFDFDGSFYDQELRTVSQSMTSSMLEEDRLGALDESRSTIRSEVPAVQSFQEQYKGDSSLHFEDNHFGKKPSVGNAINRWNSEKNAYETGSDFNAHGSPLRVRVKDTHFIWNLFDGYDWQRTRQTITQAVEDIEAKAAEKLAARREKLRALDDEDDEESVIGDFLFNSIYIGIPANHDPRELSRRINGDVNDMASETGSYATTTTVSATPSRQGSAKVKRKRLRLQRSKHHKMTFELKGISADVIVLPPDTGETQSSIDIRVNDLDIYDHVPTSTWKKFATYMHDAGERETGSSMVHIEMLTVRPDRDLLASEIVLKANVLPLRLHVDQDALDFLTRFFEFRDANATPKPPSPNDVPFLQRAEVGAIRVKLDFKPKRVDYAGLRSGHTTEFMNFFILDGADMVLRRTILYGVRGFDKLGRALNDIWMPDVRRNQLPGVLAGLAPVRSLVNVGAGVRDLVVVPMREYKKDGRVVRAVQKGAVAFAKTTTTELAKLGAKLAVGTHNILQNAEDLLAPADRDALIRPSHSRATSADDSQSDELPDEKPIYSPYADQPIGVVQGLRGAYRHLERDLLLAKDAIVAMPGEVMESNSATGAAKAVLRSAPTVILRPAMGVSKAVGQTLMGATNSLDRGERRRVEDVSFPILYFLCGWFC